MEYKHSVSLDIDKCKGCTNCLKRCPTQAIRIRGGHAVIDPRVCIDCGECIRVCPYKAKKAVFDVFFLFRLINKEFFYGLCFGQEYFVKKLHRKEELIH